MHHSAAKNVRVGSTREAIHKAATSLFAARGYAATTTREICLQAGITKPALYYHFGCKEHLYQELIVDAFNEYRKQLLLASSRGKTIAERLINVLEAIFTFVRENPRLSRLGFRMIFAPEKGAPLIDYEELCKFDSRLIEGIAGEGIRKREMKGSAQEIANALTGIATLHVIDFLIAGRPPLSRSLAERAVDLLLDGCRLRPPLPIGSRKSAG